MKDLLHIVILGMFLLQISGCASLKIESGGAELLRTQNWNGRLGLQKYAISKYGIFTTEDIESELGEPSLIEGRENNSVGYGWEYKEVRCPSLNVLFYEREKCSIDIVHFFAIFHDGILKSSTSKDFKDYSVKKLYTTKPLIQVALTAVAFKSLGDGLSDALDKFGDDHLGFFD